MKFTNRDFNNFEDIIGHFTCFIYSNILKYDVSKKGIDPEDIFQDVRIKIWNLLKNEKKIKNYTSYIKKIVDTSVIDHIRKNRRATNIISLEKRIKISESKIKKSHNPSPNSLSGELIQENIEALLENRKKVVKLFFLGLSIKEISICLSWSDHKTRNLLYRGLADLKDLIRSNEKNDV
jgi:RNA polymerase sigma factor (sigma-70 family)